MPGRCESSEKKTPRVSWDRLSSTAPTRSPKGFHWAVWYGEAADPHSWPEPPLLPQAPFHCSLT
jgi:hypothetical protein